MNKQAINRIISTIATYISADDFDGVYENQNVLDLLCDDLRDAIHSQDVCDGTCYACEECEEKPR